MSPIEEMVMQMLQLPEAELNKQSHSDLYTARSRASKEDQDRLASAEHRAFTREATAENPFLALPLLLATVGYQPYKMIRGDSRSDASLDQMLSGLTGVGEGIKQRVTSTLKGI